MMAHGVKPSRLFYQVTRKKRRRFKFYLINLSLSPFYVKICIYLIVNVFSNHQILNHIEKISLARKCSFISAATDIFSAKVSGTFKRLFLFTRLVYCS
jgi:hypothetical protein